MFFDLEDTVDDNRRIKIVPLCAYELTTVNPKHLKEYSLWYKNLERHYIVTTLTIGEAYRFIIGTLITLVGIVLSNVS